jgi:hypothetical protein
MMAAIEKLVTLPEDDDEDLSPVDEVTLGGGLGDGVALASLATSGVGRRRNVAATLGLSLGRDCDDDSVGEIMVLTRRSTSTRVFFFLENKFFCVFEGRRHYFCC